MDLDRKRFVREQQFEQRAGSAAFMTARSNQISPTAAAPGSKLLQGRRSWLPQGLLKSRALACSTVMMLSFGQYSDSAITASRDMLSERRGDRFGDQRAGSRG